MKLFKLILSQSLCFFSLAAMANSYKDETNTVIPEEVIVFGNNSQWDKTIITPETERLLGMASAGEDPLQAIYALPGVTFSADGEPVIRGSAPSDNAFYIDRVPVTKLYHLFGNSIFNKHIIQDLKLHPAAFSSQYGNATGGVIDVTLRDPRNQPFTTTASVSFLQADFLFEGGISENQAAYFSLRESTVDKIFNADNFSEEDDGTIVEEKPHSTDYQGKYIWSINSQQALTLVVAGASDDIGGELTERSNEAFVDPDFAGPIKLNDDFDSQGILWSWQSTDGLQYLDVRLTHMNSDIQFFYGADQFLKYEEDSMVLRADYQMPLFDSHSLSLGVNQSVSHFDVDANQKIVSCSDFDVDCPTVDVAIERFKESIKVITTTVYAENAIQLTDRQNITLGLHYSNNDYLSESEAEPRVRWDFQVNDDWKTYIAAGLYSQTPALEKILSQTGNPHLKNIKATHFVWGVGQALDNGWSWHTDLFYKDLSDLVVSVPDDSVDANLDVNYSNQAEGVAYGVELLINKALTEKWDGWAALSLGKAERTDLRRNETHPFDYDRPIKFDLVANYSLNDKWVLGFKWIYQTGDRYTAIVDVAQNPNHASVLEPIYGRRNAYTSPDFHRLDVRAEYKAPKAWGYWSVFFDIINVYGRENVSGYEFSPNGFDVLKTTPAGFGSHVPVRVSESDGAIPSIGFELEF